MEKQFIVRHSGSVRVQDDPKGMYHSYLFMSYAQPFLECGVRTYVSVQIHTYVCVLCVISDIYGLRKQPNSMRYI